jgi:hypothetical protein
LLQGEQRSNPNSFRTYTEWIESGAMQAAARPHADRKGYCVEWMVKADPCLEMRPGTFWSSDYGIGKVGFNIALQDLDDKEKGEGNFGNIHHEEWLCGVKDYPYLPKYWGTLHLHPSARPHEIHVAPDGDDANTGGAASPVRTLGRAQALVRERVQAGLKRDVLVILGKGAYVLDAPLVFSADDSGNETFSVTYAASPGYRWPSEEVTLSGGRPLTGWRKRKGGLWRVRLPGGAQPVRQLWRNGRRLSRCRYPARQDAFMYLEDVKETHTRFTFRESIPEFDPVGTDVEIVCLFSWAVARGLVESVSGGKLQTRTPLGWVGHGWCVAKPGMPAYLENHPDFFTQPNTWCYVPEKRELLFLAQDGQDPNDATFVIPDLERLLTVAGSPDRPVRNLHFVGLSFAHTAFPLPEFGYRGIQGGYYGTSEKPPEPVFAQAAALEFRYADNCRVELCTVAHAGASGIGLGAGCRRNTIVGNRLYDIGANGIDVGQKTSPVLSPSNILDKDWDTPRDIPLDNTVCNNAVERCAQVSKSASGIFAAYVEGTDISHNRVNDMPYGGISLGFQWNPLPSSMKNNSVEYNHIFDVMKEIADNGGIYTLGLQPDTLIRGNLIHDVHRTDYAFGGHNNGFFLDEGSKALTLEENILFHIANEPVRHNRNEAEWHTWLNNYLGVPPQDPAFPWHKAGLAGLEPAYRAKVK